MTEPNLLVVDLEATCWSDQYTPGGVPQSIHNMEIIELGCALANRQGDLLDVHSFFVRPSRNPLLSDFCTELTGITQSMVDSAMTLPQAVEAMNDWLGDLSDDFVWCSWGNYDRLHLEAQSRLDGAQPKILSCAHLNLKRIWRRTTGQKKKNGLANALAFHDLVFEGNHHRGVDDARNIVRLLPFMDWSLESELLTIPISDNS
ncbi:3'-5' exonuclease [Marinobacter nauticus]|uniref:3'-5' exonuclease n=1 Tax=Marinobacter nauticus TaxID=2743 RepID=UPI000EB21C8D|nr:3'-5' exonuclease [Marinobacter nauticus]RKR70990.1 inhibitor of KinA sporulation pathway (predicted exonuclease) [Marinobacter nauticus]